MRPPPSCPPVVMSMVGTCRKVELVDSGIDEVASETLLDVLWGRAKTVTKLDLSRNRIGMRGASALARFIGQKGNIIYLVSYAHVR